MEARYESLPSEITDDALTQVLKQLESYFIPEHRIKLRKATVGRGGSGIVRLADLSRQSWPFGRREIVAVKEIFVNDTEKFPLRRAYRLAREMLVWSGCKHENILEFTGYYLSEDYATAYLISPYVERGNALNYLSRKAVGFAERVGLVRDTVKGLQYLHSLKPPIVHGDLKPQNILVYENGRAVICDLGLAAVLQDKPTGLTTSDDFKGTIRYCSPQALNGGAKNLKSDIWAWACVTLEIMTDISPYHDVQSEVQITLLLCGEQTKRRSPEPTPPPRLPYPWLGLLKKCWHPETERRPDIQECSDVVTTIPLMKEGVRPAQTYFVPIKRIEFRPYTTTFGTLGIVSEAKISLLRSRHSLSATVAVKTIHLGSHPNTMSIFELARDLQAWFSCRHQNLFEPIGYSQSEDLKNLYLILPLLRNGNISEYVSRRPLRTQDRLDLLQDIARGLEHLHLQDPPIVHGDLSSMNVLITDDGRAVILRKLDTRGHISLFRKSHTPYNSPELIESGNATLSSDIWAWGCLAAEIMTGESPSQILDRLKAPAQWLASLSTVPTPFPSHSHFRENPGFSQVPRITNSGLQHPLPNYPRLGVTETMRLNILLQEMAFWDTSIPVPDDLKWLLESCLDRNPSLRPDASQCANCLTRIIIGPLSERLQQVQSFRFIQRLQNTTNQTRGRRSTTLPYGSSAML